MPEADNPEATVPPTRSSARVHRRDDGLRPTRRSRSPPADGSLSFEPATLDAKAGNVTLDYDNPSPVPHSIAIDQHRRHQRAEPDGANDTFELTAELKPGDLRLLLHRPRPRPGRACRARSPVK